MDTWFRVCGIRNPEQKVTNKHFHIVALGASAGGLQALKSLLEFLPCDTGFAFVVIQHVGPESILAELLAKSTEMPVHLIEDGMKVLPNHVYVNSPKIDVELSGNILGIKGIERNYGEPKRCIDHFMSTLADHRRDKAIGVVLSGTLSDGSKGIRKIKNASGTTFAQDKSAQYKDMPQNAIKTGCVDFVLPPNRIAAEITRIANSLRT
ncbi:chemotaxis protein CheB [Candidatus Peregrinibacteria bacterium]|nr:chemotaxis protein CheB [Candidatus Peregrinibacteria bacterium]